MYHIYQYDNRNSLWCSYFELNLKSSTLLSPQRWRIVETHCNWWMWSSLGGLVLIIHWHGWFERWQDVAVLLLMWLDVMCRLPLILRTVHYEHSQSSAQLSHKAKFCWWRWRQGFHTARESHHQEYKSGNKIAPRLRRHTTPPSPKCLA